jgi:Protein of unknown function (DUF1239).
MKKSCIGRNLRVVATISMVATTLFSCKDDILTGDVSEVGSLPTQVIDSMVLKQYTRGEVSFMVSAPTLERYANAEIPYNLFPNGIVLRGYNQDGFMETIIVADYAKNIIGAEEEIWEAYGDVVINNYIKGQRVETDTLYWNQKNHKIYTHRPVKITTPDSFMQGYGMESDEMARDVDILKPYDSYAIVRRDSTEVAYRDTVNIIGPFLRR